MRSKVNKEMRGILADKLPPGRTRVESGSVRATALIISAGGVAVPEVLLFPGRLVPFMAARRKSNPRTGSFAVPIAHP